MFKIMKGFLIIFLIVCTIPLNCYAESNLDSLSMNEVLKSSLDIKVNSTDDNFTINDNNSSDVILDHILDVNPDLTTGELNAIYTMMTEQFDSEFGNRKMVFYTMYLNNSTDYPVDGLPYTARELYDNPNNDYYKSWVNSVEQIINDYGHMSPQKRVDFLITKESDMKNIIEVFDNANKTEKLYLASALTKFNLPTYPTYPDGKHSIECKAVRKYRSDMHDAVKALGDEVLRIDWYYRLNYEDLLPDVDDFNNSFNNSMDKINDEISTVNKAMKNVKGTGIGCTIGGAVLLIVGICGAIKPIKIRDGTIIIVVSTGRVLDPSGLGRTGPEIEYEIRRGLDDGIFQQVPFYKAAPPIVRIILALLIPIGIALLGMGIYLLILGYYTLMTIYGFLVEIRTEMQNYNKN